MDEEPRTLITSVLALYADMAGIFYTCMWVIFSDVVHKRFDQKNREKLCKSCSTRELSLQHRG